jgi:hypothetical protein
LPFIKKKDQKDGTKLAGIFDTIKELRAIVLSLLAQDTSSAWYIHFALSICAYVDTGHNKTAF